MKKKIAAFIALVFSGFYYSQVGINTTTPDVSSNLTVAPLDQNNQPKGTLISVMTSLQRNTITTPATGLLVYDKTQKCLMSNNGTPATPSWECIGAGSSPQQPGGVSYTKHFHYAFPDSIPTVAAAAGFSGGGTDYPGEIGTLGLTPASTVMSRWLQINDPAQVPNIPTIDGIRMDIVFYQGSNANQAVVYRPLIVNTNSVSKSLIGVTVADISGRYGWPIPLMMSANNGYINVDADNILGWGNQGYLEKSVSTFRIIGDNGALYRATFYGYRDFVDSNNRGKHQIHLILEKFDSQTGGVHN